MAQSQVGERPEFSAFDPMSPQFLNDPFPIWRESQASAPVFYHEPMNYWVITRYDDVKAALTDWETFSSQAAGMVPPPPEYAEKVSESMFIDNAIIALDPPEHTASRKALARLFSPKRIKALEVYIEQLSNELIDSFIDDGRCDLVSQYCYPLSLDVIVHILGLPKEDGPLFRQWTEDFFAMEFPQSDDEHGGEREYHISEAERKERWGRLVEAFDYYKAAMDDRRANSRDDGVSLLLAAETADGQPALSDERVMVHLLEMVAAGHDTTASLIAMIVAYLAADREQFDAVQADPGLIPNVVEEGLRRHGSVRGIFRRTTRAVTVSGVEIPKGAIVCLAVQAGGHDESQFACPAHFDAHRTNSRQHISFGWGIHVCLGAGTSRLEAKIATKTLLERLPSLRLVPDQTLTFAPNIVTSNVNQLLIEWDTNSKPPTNQPT